MTARKIVAVSAGVSAPSTTTTLAERIAKAAADSLRERGIEADVEVVELRDIAHPLTAAMLSGFGTAELDETLESITTADGVVMATPVMSASVSGLFKMFIDVLDREALVDLPVALAATGGTPRHSLVTEHAMRPMLSFLKARTIGTAVYAATEDFGGSDSQYVDALPVRIDRAGRELADVVANAPARQARDEFATPDFTDMMARLGHN